MRSYFSKKNKKINLFGFDTALWQAAPCHLQSNFLAGGKKEKRGSLIQQEHKSIKSITTLTPASQYSNTQTLERQQTPLHFNLITVTYLRNLDTPVEQQLRANVVLVLVHVVQEAAVGHELGDQLDGGAQADAEETHQVGVLHAGHDQGLLGERVGGEKKNLTKKTVEVQG